MLARATGGIRRSVGGQPELVLLDAGSWTAVDPGPLKSLAEVSGYRDLLNKHQEVKAAITRLLAQSKAKVSSLMRLEWRPFWTKARWGSACGGP